MKCYQIKSPGIENIKFTEQANPEIINCTDVAIDVKACALNYRDLMVAKGQYSAGSFEPFIPLSDMAGVVRAVGSSVSEFKPGDRVINAPFRHWPAGRLRDSWAQTFVGGKGIDGVLTEKLIYPSDALVKIPPHLNDCEAATFTIAGLTAWASVVTHGKVKPGEWVLLHGTGGVSVFAAQLCHAMGARVIMTTSSPEKADLVKKNYGVFATVNYRDKDWSAQVKEVTGGIGVDVVVDVVGGETLARSLQICNYNARVAVVGALGAAESTIQTRDLLRHQIQIRGIFMESAEELRAFMQAVEALKLKPHVDKTFPFSQAIEAYRYFEAQKHVGKVVITL